MWFLELDTNLPTNLMPAGWRSGSAQPLPPSQASKDHMNVMVRPGLTVVVNGSLEPCMQLLISSIGMVGKARNRLTASLRVPHQDAGDWIITCFFLLKPLKIGKKRTVMIFLRLTWRVLNASVRQSSLP
ncbi:D-dopachrome decarboxylase [Choloepus didactylus]|uniref:D-dopachrome decarboxylase n=1 Tax=Choloepus didactylus TaxID=27675 RepID=UPI00189DE779|nr:D-dopachrome decarboxylase [Choloepus didactylus]